MSVKFFKVAGKGMCSARDIVKMKDKDAYAAMEQAERDAAVSEWIAALPEGHREPLRAKAQELLEAERMVDGVALGIDV